MQILITFVIALISSIITGIITYKFGLMSNKRIEFNKIAEPILDMLLQLKKRCELGINSNINYNPLQDYAQDIIQLERRVWFFRRNKIKNAYSELNEVMNAIANNSAPYFGQDDYVDRYPEAITKITNLEKSLRLI